VTARSALRAIAAAAGTLALSSAAALAGPLAPSRPSQLVSAYAVSQVCAFDPNGVNNTPYQISRMTGIDGVDAPFVIPPKQVFVITSVRFTFGGPVPGTIVNLQLLSFDATGNYGLLAEARATAESDQVGQADVLLPTGIPVRADKTLCIIGSSGATGGMVHGFFAKDR
jgi:hypothetical protein